MKTMLAAVVLSVGLASAGVGWKIGHTMGHADGYEKGYADNTYYHHGCDTPTKAGETIECHRYPMYLGKNTDGLQPVRIVVDQALFDRWIQAREDKDEPSSGIDCRINALGKIDECSFPVG